MALQQTDKTNNHVSWAESSELESSKKIHVWQHFHIRLMVVYGGTIFIALLVLGAIFYSVLIESELKSLQQRILARVTELAASIDGDKIVKIPLGSTKVSNFQIQIAQRFKESLALDQDITNIYIFRPTDEPTTLRFFVDVVKGEEGEAPGKPYNATDIPVMLQGFSKPTVENEPYTDDYGTTLSAYAPIRDFQGKSIAIVGADVNAGRIYAQQYCEIFTHKYVQ